LKINLTEVIRDEYEFQKCFQAEQSSDGQARREQNHPKSCFTCPKGQIDSNARK
jgi:hypothetical protein